MIGIDKAAEALGLSERQVYRRISDARPVLSGHVRKGENNKLLLDGSAVEILRAVEDCRKTGLTVSQSIARIRDSIGGNRPENTGKRAEIAPETAEPWKLIIAAKDETIEALKAENAHLRGEVERLMPLALPAPRRGFLGLFRRQKTVTAG